MAELDPESPEAVAERLKQLREIMGFGNGTAFAQWLGLPPPRYLNFERGLPLGRKAAMILVRKCPVTLDWLYRGRQEGLSLEMSRKVLAEAPAGQAREGVSEAS